MNLFRTSSASIQGNVVGQAEGFHAVDLRGGFADSRAQVSSLCLGIAEVLKTSGQYRHIARGKPWINVAKVAQALYAQSHANEHQCADGHLNHNQSTANSPFARAADRDFSAQCAGKIWRRR